MTLRLRLLALAVVGLLVASGAGVAPAPAQAAQAQLEHVGTWVTGYGEFHTQPGASTEAFSAAAVGDVDGDDRADVIVGGMDGYIYGFHRNGERFLRYDTGAGAVSASPTLVDFNRDGRLDILTGNEAGRVVVVTGRGRRIFVARTNTAYPLRGVFGTPAAADLDGDGDLEVVATSWDTFVYAWNKDGSNVPGFPQTTYDTIWSSPTIVDFKDDGKKEIVVGGDMDSYPGQPYPTGGLVWVFRHNGQRKAGFPRTLPGQVIWSTPAVTDLNGDGNLDIVVGTGLHFGEPAGRRLIAIDRNGNDLPGWPVPMPGRVMASPALGDLSGDGRPEVATLSEGGWVVVHSWNGVERWRACNTSSRSCPDGYPTHGSVSIADVDNDGEQEVVSAAEHYLRVFDGATGAIERQVVLDGSVWAPAAAPTIAEVAGETWIVQNATLNTNPANARGVGDSNAVFVYTTNRPLGRAGWPTFKYNMRRIGTR